MLVRDDFHAFIPAHGVPLVVSFVEFLRERGLSTVIQFGFWDFLAFDHDDDPLIAIKSVRNRVTGPVLGRMTTDPTPWKVLLLEGSNPAWSALEEQGLFLAATGTGVFVRNVGWRVLPGAAVRDDVQDLRLKLAPRWRQDPDGVWRKACTRCGERKGLEAFYVSAYKTAKDPRRNICIPCWHARIN